MNLSYDQTQEMTEEDVNYIFSKENMRRMQGEKNPETETHVFATHPRFFVNRQN